MYCRNNSLSIWWSKIVCVGDHIKGYEFKLLNCYNTWSLSQKRWFNVFIMLLIYAIFNKKGLENHITTYYMYTQFNKHFLHLQLLNLLQDLYFCGIFIIYVFYFIKLYTQFMFNATVQCFIKLHLHVIHRSKDQLSQMHLTNSKKINIKNNKIREQMEIMLW